MVTRSPLCLIRSWGPLPLLVLPRWFKGRQLLALGTSVWGPHPFPWGCGAGSSLRLGDCGDTKGLTVVGFPVFSLWLHCLRPRLP